MEKLNTNVIALKLKRHKISYTIENGKLIMGKPKTDYTTILGLIVLPLFAAVAILFTMILVDLKSRRVYKYLIAAIISLGGVGITSLKRLKDKKKANKSLKILGSGFIRIKDENRETVYTKQNVKAFEYTTELTDDESIYKANLFLKDTSNNKHLIFGFYEENKKLALDDLKWFADYFTNHIKIEAA